ncbi:MAG TPA: hypothetical protein VLK33_19845 [Terriglobales bacterium]|nr:hypothetical protein [Terriglobales bacterium]
MQVSFLDADANGEIITDVVGDFVKIELVPSGNVLTIKTTGAAPGPIERELPGNSGNTPNENESFVGSTGRSIKFENQFQRLEITGAMPGEEIVIQTGFGWMMDSVDFNAQFPNPIGVEGIFPETQVVPNPSTQKPVLVGGYFDDGSGNIFPRFVSLAEDQELYTSQLDDIRVILGNGPGATSLLLQANHLKKSVPAAMVFLLPQNGQPAYTGKYTLAVDTVNFGALGGVPPGPMVVNALTGAAVAANNLVSGVPYYALFAGWGSVGVSFQPNPGDGNALVQVTLMGEDPPFKFF